MRLLVIEDDLATREYLARGLAEGGHIVDASADGSEGLTRALERDYDCLIVDRMLPVLDGLSLVQTVRSAGKKTPILILSALGEVDDRVEGLRKGGDDYLVKPFAFSELVARVEALARRSELRPSSTKLSVADLEMDLVARKVIRGGRPVELQPKEFKLLEYLMRHSGQVVTRTMMLEKVWDYNFDPQTNVIDVHVSRLRRKIDSDADSPLIYTIRGTGYMLRAPQDSDSD